MLHQLLEAAGMDATLNTPVERCCAFAVGLTALDLFIAYGPFSGALLRLFGQGPAGTKPARRFLSQLAAKAVGSVFLAAVMPGALRVLREPALRAAPFTAVSAASQRAIEVASGYFLYDLVLCTFKFTDNGADFLLHAVVCCTVYTAAALRGVLHFYGAAFLMWELSTPFMYLRWLLLKAGLGGSAAMPAADAAFVLAFFGCRVVWGPIMTVAFWRDSATQLALAAPVLPPPAIWVVRGMSLALNGLNYWWFAKMLRIALGGGAKAKAKAV